MAAKIVVVLIQILLNFVSKGAIDDKFFAQGQAHMGQMGKWPWQCTPTGLGNSTELRREKIRQAVTEIWVLQVWQPPAWPPGPWQQYPSGLEGWGVKTQFVKS